MSKDMGDHVSHRGAERDHIEDNRDGGSSSTSSSHRGGGTYSMSGYTGKSRGQGYYLAALLTLQIISIFITILPFAWGIARCFPWRYYTALMRNEPDYWVATVLLIIVPLPMLFMIFFYIRQLQRWTAFMSLTFIWRGVFWILLGSLCLTREFYDIIVACVLVVLGCVYMLIEFFPFIPKPQDGLIPLRRY